MGNTEDDQGRVLDDIPQVRDRDKVSREGNVRQVSRVLVSSVDHVGQFLAVDLAAHQHCEFLTS